MSEVTFSPHMLKDLTSLKEYFFSGEKELSEITKFSRKDKPVRELYFNTWEITLILSKAPFNALLALFLNATGFLCAAFAFRSLSNRLYLQATYAIKEQHIAIAQFLYGRRLVVPTINEYKEGLEDVYNHDPINRENIKNPFIRKKLDSRYDNIPFNCISKGLCHGAVEWFNFLFLKSLNTNFKNRVDSLWQYLTPIAKQFQSGQPRQAALLQSLYGLRDLLKLHDVRTRPLQVDLTDTLKAINAIKQLPDGVFNLTISRHEVSYIKLNGEQCVWDPNDGLIVIETPQHLLQILLKYSHNSHGQDIYFEALSLNENHFPIPHDLTNESEVLKKINALPAEGIFTLKISGSVIPYIRYYTLQYILDPNGQLIHIQKPEDLLKVFLKYTHSRKRSSISLAHRSIDEVLISPIPFDLTKTDEVLTAIKDLPDGLSLIEMSDNKIIYTKHNGKTLISDPIDGLITIEKPEDLLEIFLKYTDNKRKSKIIFAPVLDVPVYSHWIKQWINPLVWLGIH